MTVRADWKLAEAVADEDPFAAVVFTPGIEIDLTAPEEELAAKLTELMAMEQALVGRDIRCKLKDGGQDCLTCPQATLNPALRRSALCRVGKDQATVWAAGEARYGQRMGPILEMAKIADEMSEIGHLDGEMIELLAAVGL